MARPVELNKTWLPGPSRGTQTFNAPSNLTIPYGRHKATISGRGGSGNNPGAQYLINYTINYNVQAIQGNTPEASRPETAWTTNYTRTYSVGNPYQSQYSITYTINNNINSTVNYTYSYNTIDTQVYSISSTSVYNPVSVYYNQAYTVSYNQQGNQPATAWNTAYNAVYGPGDPVASGYNPPTGFNWNGVISYEVEKRVSAPGEPVEYSVFVNNLEYVSGSGSSCPAWVYNINGNMTNPGSTEYRYDAHYDCTPSGNNPAFVPGFTTNYSATTTENAWTTNYVSGTSTAYRDAWQINYVQTINYNYAINYTRNTPQSYTAITNYAYGAGSPSETGRPVNAWATNYTFSYNVGNRPATTWTVLYSTNYNLAYPEGNRPAVNYVITGYAPGAAGDPATVLGVYFPGGGVGAVAPYVSETVVRYWDYPDYKTHPVSVPPGGQITIKLE